MAYSNLQDDVITPWRELYDNSGVTSVNGPNYIGSVLGASGFHQGPGIYNPSPAPGLAYEIYDFNWYAGQGVDSSGFGAKFLAYSECGFSWDTTYDSGTGKYSFVTEGSIDTLYLGYNPSGDVGASPASAYLTAFDPAESLLVISNFDVVVDEVAAYWSIGDGNTPFATPSWVANGGLYDQVTLNSAVLYGLAFDLPNTAGGTALEIVLDTYLENILGVTGGLSAGQTAIDAALAAASSVVQIDYYDTASAYVSNGVVTEALAQQYLDTSECDLLLAA
ncbi:hypothetical protein CW959_001649 [Salmonella enterica subsp. enterica serovar Mbandaka]|nr:hypothetical protein [Salmonella enterica subsp. enterica serovar Mbandaka]EDU8579623.1 hypothetical protein [Salmonella enterica subsp. enterica serovar Mbandaka]